MALAALAHRRIGEGGRVEEGGGILAQEDSTTLPEPEPKRPRAVTVIGWLWLVLGAFWLMRSLVNLIFWKLLQTGVPGLLQSIAEQSPYSRFLRQLFRHLTALLSLQAIASAAIGFSAYQLLRLRPWARVAVQAVCWCGLTYVASFAAFWIWLWPRAVAAKTAADTSFSAPLAAGVVVCLALGAGLAGMIVLLRGSKVRAAFRHPP